MFCSHEKARGEGEHEKILYQDGRGFVSRERATIT